MKKRNPIAVILLSLVTFGFYTIYWHAKTKGELNARGAQIPTTWLFIIPFVNIWWVWKYSEGVNQVTKGNPNDILTFVLILLLPPIGQGVLQHYFNEDHAGAPVVNEHPNTAAVVPPVPESTVNPEPSIETKPSDTAPKEPTATPPTPV